MGFSASMKPSWVRGSCIGRGSFGAVNLAAYKSTGEVFAVKSVSAASSAPLQALENEIGILRSISSPYVVAYLGDDATEEPPPAGRVRNLHMEYMPGGTVADLAVSCHKAGGSMDEAELRAYARCAVRGLWYLHSVAGVVHGDVKGKNILVGHSRGSAKLADFGSARRMDGSEEDRATGGLQGTPLWMAPEVVRGGLQTPASDVWSLGCTVVEMATGQAPWREKLGELHRDAAGALFMIGFGGEVPEIPSHLSKAGRDFVDKCLRRDPRERWSCEELQRHPFLCEEEAGETEQSPRCVLDWMSSEFQSEEEEDSDFGSGFCSLSADARERLGELSSSGGSCWGDEDADEWEVVRSGGAASATVADGVVVEENEEEEQGTGRGYSNCEGCGSDRGRASGGETLPTPAGCSSANSFHCGVLFGSRYWLPGGHPCVSGGGAFQLQGGCEQLLCYLCFVWLWLIHIRTLFLISLWGNMSSSCCASRLIASSSCYAADALSFSNLYADYDTRERTILTCFFFPHHGRRSRGRKEERTHIRFIIVFAHFLI